MFKRTEEQEWTRFSKALSSRETDDSTDTEKTDATSEAEPADVAPPSPPPTPVVPNPIPPVTSASPRPIGNDVNVSVSRIAQPTSRASFVGADVQTVIGQQTTFSGTLKSEAAIRVLGSVDGEVISSQAVVIEESASVKARVTAETVTVAGEITGEIVCAGRVEILPSGRVRGEIQAGTLVMQEGAFFEGHLKMSTGPSLAESTEDSQAPTPVAARARR